MYQRITSQSSPISLGAKNYSAVLSQRLRISSSEARRRLDEAALLGPRTSLTGEPLAPSMPTFARGQAQGLIGAERIKHVRWFFRELPGFVDFQTRENAEVQLAQHACELGPAEFRTAAAHMLYLLNQDGEAVRVSICARAASIASRSATAELPMPRTYVRPPTKIRAM